MKELLLDANVLLSFLLQGSRYEEALEMLEADSCFQLPPYILPEVVYVLSSHEYPRKNISNTLLKFIEARTNISCEEYLVEALALYSYSGLDFPDCCLIAQALDSGREVASFDKKLQKTLASLN
jgi:predicted nucleic-acid-binding protein